MSIFTLKKREFRPDHSGSGQLKKFWPTPKQQLRGLRWLLYGVVCLVGLLIQDVALYRVDVAGGCTDLVPCLILAVAVIQGVEAGSVFTLVAATLFFFSGSSAGFHVIPLLTFVSVTVVIFRQAFLRRGLGTVLLCTAAGMLLYELGLFAINLFLKLTMVSRIGTALITAALSLIVVPIAYPVMMAIGKLGGEAWGE